MMRMFETFFVVILTLYHIILSFNDLEKENYNQQFCKMFPIVSETEIIILTT